MIVLFCVAVCCEMRAQDYDSLYQDLERRAEILRMQLEEQNKEAKTDLAFIGELGYEHSERHGHLVQSTMQLQWDGARWFTMFAGLRVTTQNLYNLSLRGDFKIPFKGYRYLGLRNQYLYGIFANSNYMDMNFSLSAFYEQEYFYVAAGAMTHFVTPITVKEGTRSYDWYVSWTYDIRGWVQKHDARWNLGVQVTNMREMEISEGYMPSFVLRGSHLILPKSSPMGFHLNWQIGCRTKIAEERMAYDGAWATVGVHCWF